MGNGGLANAPGGDHVEQVSNLLVAPTATPASREVREQSEPRMARIDANDGRGEQDAGDDAERLDESAQPVCVPSFGVVCPETLDGTRDQPIGRCPPAALLGHEKNGESMGMYGESTGNCGIADAPGDNHVEQVSNLLVSPTATPAIREVQEETDQ
jgi:hypothetical protein